MCAQGGVLAVGSAGLDAAVEDADEAVGELAQGDALTADAALLDRFETLGSDEPDRFSSSMAPITLDFAQFVGMRQRARLPPLRHRGRRRPRNRTCTVRTGTGVPCGSTTTDARPPPTPG
jgi:hypothetical protein